MKRLFFRKSQRLLGNGQFKAVLSGKQSAGQGPFRVFLASNQLDYARLGISISKSAGQPVLRNRLKRLARETFRTNQHNLPAGMDYVLIISPKMTKDTSLETRNILSAMSYKQFEDIFIGLIHRVIRKIDIET